MSCRNAALTVITIFSRLYPEFSQQLNDFAPKTQGNGSKTQVPGGFDQSNLLENRPNKIPATRRVSIIFC